jgi:hypothetical protein
MNADIDEFEDPSPGYLCRIAIGALALLAMATILAATLQIMGPAFGAAPVLRVTVVADASFLHFSEDDDLPPAAEAPVQEYF